MPQSGDRMLKNGHKNHKIPQNTMKHTPDRHPQRHPECQKQLRAGYKMVARKS